jgi:hypothetical protein
MQANFFPGVLDRGDWFRERDLQIKVPRVRPSFARSKSRCRRYGRVKPPGSERRSADLPAVRALRDSFCHEHGADQYRDLGRAMTAALCRKRAGESLTEVKRWRTANRGVTKKCQWMQYVLRGFGRGSRGGTLLWRKLSVLRRGSVQVRPYPS